MGCQCVVSEMDALLTAATFMRALDTTIHAIALIPGAPNEHPMVDPCRMSPQL